MPSQGNINKKEIANTIKIKIQEDLPILRNDRKILINVKIHEKLYLYDFLVNDLNEVLEEWLSCIRLKDFEIFVQILNARMLTHSQKQELLTNYPLEDIINETSTSLKEIQDHFIIAVDLYHTWKLNNAEQ
jgi:hypothetical protein